MTSAEFVEITNEIEKFYDKELNSTERKIWFEELKKLSKERYRQLIRECFKNNKFMPKLSDILTYQRVLPLPHKEDDTIEKCSICRSLGFLIYERKIEDYSYTYAARCTCANGNKFKKYPSIQEVHLINE